MLYINLRTEPPRAMLGPRDKILARARPPHIISNFFKDAVPPLGPGILLPLLHPLVGPV